MTLYQIKTFISLNEETNNNKSVSVHWNEFGSDSYLILKEPNFHLSSQNSCNEFFSSDRNEFSLNKSLRNTPLYLFYFEYWDF